MKATKLIFSTIFLFAIVLTGCKKETIEGSNDIEFKSDNAFITNQSRCKDISTLVNGTFSIDTKNRTLSRFENGQKTEDVYYELLDKLLTLRHKENSSSTIVLEKTE